MIFYEIFYKESYSKSDIIYSPDTANGDSTDLTTRVVSKANLVTAVNEASKLTFTLPKFHPLYDKIVPYGGTIVIYETVNNGARHAIFCGKATSVEIDYHGNKDVTVQGGLGWLKFSYYSRWMGRWPKVVSAHRSPTQEEIDAGIGNKTWYVNDIPNATIDGTAAWDQKYFSTSKFAKEQPVDSVVSKMLRIHNWQMSQNDSSNLGNYSSIIPGTMKIRTCLAKENPYGINVKKTDDTQSEGVYISRAQDSIIPCYDWLQNEIIEKCAANIVVDEETNDIDIYGETLPKDDSQVIRAEENILDFNRRVDYSDLCTAFLPIGQSNSASGTVLKTDSTGEYVEYNTSPDDSTMIIASIADSSEENTQVDQTPECYVATYGYDESGGDFELQFNDKGKLVDSSGGEIIELPSGIVRFGTSSLSSAEAVIATPEQFPGGITFYLDPPFIIWKEGEERYGRIVKTKQWSSATRSQLRAYGPAHFKKLILSSEEVEIKVLDKGYYDPDVGKSVELGKRYRVISEYHSFDEYVPCMEKDVDLLNPANTKYTFKRSKIPFTKIVRSISKRVKALSDNATPRPTELAVSVVGKDKRPVALS